MSGSSQHPNQQGGFSLFPGAGSSKLAQKQTRHGRRSESQDRHEASPTSRNDTPDHTYTNIFSSPASQHAQQTSYTSAPPNNLPSTNWPLTDGPQPEPQAVEYEVVAQGSSQQPRNAPDQMETTPTREHTLVRSSSILSRSSIAKHPLDDNTSSSSLGPQPLKSIFPTYNPNVPLREQEYAPTQMSPTHIPRAIISRQSFYDEPVSPTPQDINNITTSSPQQASDPQPVTRGRWPLRIQTQNPPASPNPCSTDDLKSLWKIANGWKASVSEGRVFCLKLSRQQDAPVYTLSSATSHPFWNLRLDPTSTAAHISLTRHDPSKPAKEPRADDSSPANSSSSSGRRSSDTKKTCHEVLSTTLEEESRKHPPNDGLVALLMPTAATKMAISKANDAGSVAAAENECARLVWDEDTATHYLVHNALANPFCVTVDRNPSYSKVEYTLEHNEAPRHIAKLTRDGTGAGWIELNTSVAALIDACYILDVVVAALLLVAAVEDRNSPAPVESFEPPPPVYLGPGRNDSNLSSQLSVGRDGRVGGRRRMEEFEIDLESQDDSLGKGRRGSKFDKDNLPISVRVVIKMAKALFALLIWILTILFKCVAGVLKLLYGLVGSKY